jgi:predicted nucleic acid-binding protein
LTKYLLDTNVISAMAPGKHSARPLPNGFAAWLEENDSRLFLSVVSIVEFEAGLKLLGRKSPGRYHRDLEEWYDGMQAEFAERLLLIDVPIARLAAEITDANAAQGFDTDLADATIAATARHHRMTLLTRNVRHFVHAGLAVIDPFTTRPE